MNSIINADLLSTLASFQALITPQISLKPTITSPVEEDEKKPLPLQRNGISQSTIDFWRAEKKKMSEEKDKVEKPPAKRASYAAKRKYPDYPEKEMQKLLLRLRESVAPVEYDPQEGSSTSSSTQSPQPINKNVGVQAVPPVQAIQVPAVEPNQDYLETLKGLLAHPSLKSVLQDPTSPASLEILKNIELNAKAHDEKLRKIQDLPPKYSKFDGIGLAYLYGVYQSLTAEDTDRFGPFDFGPLGVWIKKMVDLHLELVAIEERKNKVALHPDKIAKLDEKAQVRMIYYKNLIGAPFADHVQNVQWVLMHKTAIKIGRLKVDNKIETRMAVKSPKGGIHAISFPRPTQVVGTCDTEQLNQLMEYYKANMLKEVPVGPKPAKIAKKQGANAVESESSGLSSAAPAAAAVATAVSEMNGIWMNGEGGGGFPIPATSSTASSSAASSSGLNWNPNVQPTVEQVALIMNNLNSLPAAILALLNPQGSTIAPTSVSSASSLPTSSTAPLLQAALLNSNTTVSAPSIVPAPVPYVPSTVESAPISFAPSLPSVSLANFLQASTLLSPLQIVDFNQLNAAASAFTSPPVQASSSALLGVRGNGAVSILEDQGNQPSNQDNILNSPLYLNFRQNQAQSTSAATASSFLSPTLAATFQPQIIPVHAPRSVFPVAGRPNPTLLVPGLGCETSPISSFFHSPINPSSSFYSQPTLGTTNTTLTSIHYPVLSSSLALSEYSNSVIQETGNAAAPISSRPTILASVIIPPGCSRRSSIANADSIQAEFLDNSSSIYTSDFAPTVVCQPDSPVPHIVHQEPATDFSSTVQSVLQMTSDISSPEGAEEPIAEPIEDFEDSTILLTHVAFSEESPLQAPETSIDYPVVLHNNSIDPIEFSDASSSETVALDVAPTVVSQPDSPVVQVVKQEPDCSDDFDSEFQNSDILEAGTEGLTATEATSGLQASSSDDDCELMNREIKTEEEEIQANVLKIEIPPSESSEVSLQCSTSTNSPIPDQPTPPSTNLMLPENSCPGPIFKFPSFEDADEIPNPVQELMAQLEEETNRKNQLLSRIDELQKDLLPFSLQWHKKVKYCDYITELLKTDHNLTDMEVKEYERRREAKRDSYAPLSVEIRRRQAVLSPLEKERDQMNSSLKQIREQLRKHGIDIPEPKEKKREIQEDEEDAIPEPPSSIPSDPLQDPTLHTASSPPNEVSGSQSSPKMGLSGKSHAEKLEGAVSPVKEAGEAESRKNAESSERLLVEEFHRLEQKKTGLPATPQGGFMKIKVTPAVLRDATEKTKMFNEAKMKEEKRQEKKARKLEKEARRLEKRRRTDGDRKEDQQRSNRSKRVRMSIS